jgi:hypothetical protein
MSKLLINESFQLETFIPVLRETKRMRDHTFGLVSSSHFYDYFVLSSAFGFAEAISSFLSAGSRSFI